MTIGLVLAAMAMQAPPGMIRSFWDGTELHQICSSEEGAADCSNYIAGVLDGFETAQNRTRKRFICFPGLEPDLGGLVRIVKNYLQENPDHRKYTASGVIMNAVEEHFSCRKSKAEVTGMQSPEPTTDSPAR